MENFEERYLPIVVVEELIAARNLEKILEAPRIDRIFLGTKELSPSSHDRANRLRPLHTAS